MIEIYSDGAYNPALNQGGWASVIVEGKKKRVLSGTVLKTTSSRMEIIAAMEGISETPEGAEVTLYTDSQYIYGCVAKGWQRKANTDLWEKFEAIAGKRKMTWNWIDQNVKNPYQREAHTVATSLSSQELPEPPPFEEEVIPPTPKLTHMDETGMPRMVSVTEKPDTKRQAIAKGLVRMQPETFTIIREGKAAKGDVLSVARLAGIMGAKQTPHLIPLTHPILIGSMEIDFSLNEEDSTIEITTTVECTGKTGVEIEALTATAIAALTIYDMVKAIDHGMKIENIRLVKKSGGKSGIITLE